MGRAVTTSDTEPLPGVSPPLPVLPLRSPLTALPQKLSAVTVCAVDGAVQLIVQLQGEEPVLGVLCVSSVLLTWSMPLAVPKVPPVSSSQKPASFWLLLVTRMVSETVCPV